MSWVGYAAVFAAFFLTHSIPVRPAVKSHLTSALGARGFGLGYSILSLGMLTILIWSAGQAPYVQLWPQVPWQRHVTHLGMLAVCLLLALSIARPNPFSFGGARNEAYDPRRPGITGLTRHPILIALALWAGVHLLPNGDVAHILLFGVLGVFAIAGRSLIDRRKRRIMGAEQWHSLDKSRRAAPKLHAPRSWPRTVLRILLGLGAFVALILAHPHVIGVPAL